MASVINNTKKRGRSQSTPISDRKAKTTVASQSINRKTEQNELFSNLVKRRRDLMKKNVSVIESKLKSLSKTLENCKGKRWLTRCEKDCEKEIQTLLNERELILSGSKLRDFDNVMRPVMRRLLLASKSFIPSQVEEAEREVRKRLTLRTDAICLQRAAVGDMCEDCGVSMRVIASDSLLGCPQCAKSRIIPIVSAPIAESEYVSTPYAQKSRLVEWLEFCQGKEYSEPSDEVLDLIMKQLVIQKSTGLEQFELDIAEERLRNGPFLDAESSITRLQTKIPDIRQKLLSIKALTVRSAMQSASCENKDDRLRKFYERSPKYSSYISGFWPLRFSSSQEERIRKLYSAAVPAYEKFRNPSQPNWPGGYSYFLRCLCVLLGWDEFLDHFNVTAGQKNIQERENTRRLIWTNDLDWEYIPCNPNSGEQGLKNKVGKKTCGKRKLLRDMSQQEE